MHLKDFYRTWFPYELFHRFAGPNFPYREIVYTRSGNAPRRYQTLPANAQDFKDHLCSSVPPRIDLGPEYSTELRLRPLHLDLEPVRRELCFDIDVTDYADIRGCQNDEFTHIICKKCWQFVAVAIRATDYILRTVYGFKHLLWLFSGRRGAHCWVLDEAGLTLPDSARRNIIEFFKGLSTLSLHGSAGRNLVDTILKPHFEKMMAAGIITWTDRIQTILIETLGTYAVQGAMQLLEAQEPELRMRRWTKLFRSNPEIYERFILRCTAPRLDWNVSRSMNHLLRAPFSVHQETGALCSPILVNDALFEFDPKCDSINVSTGQNTALIAEAAQRFAVNTMCKARWFTLSICWYCFTTDKEPFVRMPQKPYIFQSPDEWHEHMLQHHPDQDPRAHKSTLGACVEEKFIGSDGRESYEHKQHYYFTVEKQFSYLK